MNRKLAAGILVLGVGGIATPAFAGRKAILRAVVNALFPMTATQTIDVQSCGCVTAPCNGAYPLFCGGGAGDIGLLAAVKAALPEPDGCRVCACNMSPSPITLIAVANC